MMTKIWNVVVDNNCFVLNQGNKYKGVIDQIKTGDILLLKYKNQLIGYGRAISSLQTGKDLSQGEEWSWRIDDNKRLYICSKIIKNEIRRYKK